MPRALLDSYVGEYVRADSNREQLEITRNGDQLDARIGGVRFLLFAESGNKFFAKTTDLQVEFGASKEGKAEQLTWSVGEGANLAKRKQ